MDVGSALAGALVAPPLSGLAGTWLGAAMNREQQRTEHRRADVDAALDALRDLRDAYRRGHHDANAPEPVVVAGLEDEVRRRAGCVSDRAEKSATQYIEAGQVYYAGSPGSDNVEQVAYNALRAILSAARRGGYGGRGSRAGGAAGSSGR